MTDSDSTVDNLNRPLTIENLTVRGGNGFELRVPSLSLALGDVLGIVGANGSGKTSLIESVLGFRDRVSGSVQLFGRDQSETAKSADSLRHVGVQLQTVCYPENFKVRELVDLHRLMYGTVKDGVRHSLGIEELHKLSYGKLSRGQKQRVDLYMALAHEPTLAVLDEPGTGLDHGFQNAFSTLLAARAADPRVATVICSHASLELDACNRVLWLKAGQVQKLIERRKHGSELRPLIASKLRVKTAPAEAALVHSIIASHPGVLHHEQLDPLSVLIYGQDAIGELVDVLRRHPGVEDIEVYQAGNSDFLRLVTLDSEREAIAV